MISVVICSKDADRYAAVEAMYHAAFGDEPWELIRIPDAQSLAEGYARGVARAKGEQIILSHDDVHILSPQLPQRVRSHLERFDLIGIVGTSRLCNGRWISAGFPYIFGQICHFQPDKRSIFVDVYGAPRRVIRNIQALDGVFMAARRAVFDKVAFDAATFDGFHLYDLDFSYAAYQSGLRLAVANDINLVHFSVGAFGDEYTKYAKRFEAKWAGKLAPLTSTEYQWSGVLLRSSRHALEVMNPPYWDDEP